MTTLLRTTIPRTLAVLERRLAGKRPIKPAQAWVFEPAPARRAAEARLAEVGVRAVIRSAYKPLLCAFIEEIELDDIDSIEIEYPVVAGVPASRFLLECYPLDGVVGGRSLTFRPVDIAADRDVVDAASVHGERGKGDARLEEGRQEDRGQEDGERENGARREDDRRGGTAGVPLSYLVTLRSADGTRRTQSIAAPNRWADDASGATALRNCGWYEGVLPTDLEQAFDATLAAIGAHPWPLATGGPLFDCLSIRLRGPFIDEPLAVDEECLSLAEAMHEEFYFAGLETFSRLLGLPPGTRELRPGQIVPVVQAVADGDWDLDVTVEAAPPVETTVPDTSADASALMSADRWLAPGTIEGHLDAIGGEAVATRSHRGRSVRSRHVRAASADVAVVLSAGQHSNETTAPVGVLRAAYDLRAEDRTDFFVTPLLNPDGYALFRACCEEHPTHMHHAARYTALGDDLECGDPVFEKGAWIEARERTGASLHINCHGYPSHEWTRPLSGYLPRGFELWTIPKGFFLILRHAAGHRESAERIVDACVAALNGFDAVMAINAEQLERYARYVSDDDATGGVEIRSGVPVFVTEHDDGLFPLTLITEAPDETVYGERFRVLQEAQRRVVLAAVDAHRAAGGTGPPA